MKSYIFCALALWVPFVVAEDCVRPELNFEPVIVGKAWSQVEGSLRYCEWHSELTEASTKEVVYTNVKGEVIAKKSLDYSYGLSTPAFEQISFLSGEQRKVERSGDHWSLVYKESESDSLDSTKVQLKEVDVIDAGFVEYTIKNWDALLGGEIVDAHFASTLYQKVLNLRIRKKAVEDCSLPSGNNVRGQTLCFWVEPRSAFLRLFMGELTLLFDQEKRLLVYSGVVNIKDEQGESQKLKIEYQYGN